MWSPPRPGSTAALHVLRGELDTARAGGERFGQAWPAAVNVALDGVPGQAERQEWRWVFERTRSTWERCYTGRAARPTELALDMIKSDRDVALPDMSCEHCGAEVVQPAAGRPRVFCSERCRRDASVARAADRSLAA